MYVMFKALIGSEFRVCVILSHSFSATMLRVFVCLLSVLCQSKNASRNWIESSSHHRVECWMCNGANCNAMELHTKTVSPAHIRTNKMRPQSTFRRRKKNEQTERSTQIKQTEMPQVMAQLNENLLYSVGTWAFNCLIVWTKRTRNGCVDQHQYKKTRNTKEVSRDHWLETSFFSLLNYFLCMSRRWLDTRCTTQSQVLTKLQMNGINEFR